MGDFTVLINHLNTTFKHVQVAQEKIQRREKKSGQNTNLDKLDELAEKQTIGLKDCISYDYSNNFFQLNPIPLRILLLQDKKNIAQKFIIDAISLNWQLKQVSTTSTPKVDASVNVDLITFQNLSEKLLKGLSSI